MAAPVEALVIGLRVQAPSLPCLFGSPSFCVVMWVPDNSTLRPLDPPDPETHFSRMPRWSTCETRPLPTIAGGAPAPPPLWATVLPTIDDSVLPPPPRPHPTLITEPFA